MDERQRAELLRENEKFQEIRANRQAEIELDRRPIPSQQRRELPVIIPDPEPVEPEKKPKREKKPVDLVAIWPLIGFAADRAGHGCAFRLWSLAWGRAHELDPNGTGKISRSDLVAYCKRQGVNERTLRRWIADAEVAHFLRAARGGSVYLLYGRETLANRLRSFLTSEGIGRQAVNVPARGLAHNKAVVWGGFLTSLIEVHIKVVEDVGPDDKIQRTEKEVITWPTISRERLEEISGVPACTQRRFEASLKVKNKKNYVLTGLDASGMDGFKEFYNKPAFACRLPRRRGQRSKPVILIAYRLPDTRKYGKHTDLRRPGRSWRINAALVASALSSGREVNSHSLDSQQAKSLLARGFVREQRLFFGAGEKAAEAIEAAARRIGASDRRDIGELFQSQPTVGRRCGWWQEVAVGH